MKGDLTAFGSVVPSRILDGLEQSRDSQKTIQEF